jgi:hypothetical protein
MKNTTFKYITNKSQIKKRPKPPEAKNVTAARILHNEREFVLDFIEEDEVVERIISNPMAMKKFCQDLSEAVDEYEEEHGRIKIVQPRQESLFSEVKRNLYRGRKKGNVTVVNPKRKK